MIATLLTALLVQASPNTAPQTDGAAVLEIAPIVVKEEEICKRTTVAGSQIKKRMCATASEWEAQRRHSRQTTAELQRNRGSTKGG